MKFTFALIVLLSLNVSAMCLDFTKVNDDQIRALPSSGPSVVVHFWATWCAPCRAEISMLNRMQKKYPRFHFIAVNLDDAENRGAIQGFLKKHPIQFKIVLRDGKDFEKMAHAFDPQWSAGVPATFVYSQGKQVFARIGAAEESELDSVLQQHYNQGP